MKEKLEAVTGSSSAFVNSSTEQQQGGEIKKLEENRSAEENSHIKRYLEAMDRIFLSNRRLLLEQQLGGGNSGELSTN